MGLKNKYQFLLLGAIQWGIGATFAHAADTKLDLVPAINPSAKCLMDEVRVPENMPDYQFISNSDCTAYFVLPPSINKQRIVEEASGSLNLCEAVSLAQSSIVDLEAQKKVVIGKIAELDEIKPKNDSQKEKIKQDKADLRKEIEEYNASLDAENDRLFSTYGQVPGAKYSILLDSQVNPKHLSTLSFENRKTVMNPLLTTLGLPAEYEVRPYFIEADIENSIYSFTYYSPDTRNKYSNIISSTMPGQVLLEELNGKYKTVHVKLRQTPTAELELNLIGVCQAAVKGASGEYYLNEEGKKPIFTVNRSYSVQEQFKYGYVATMKSDEVTKQVVNEIITSMNKGFKKDQIFSNIMNANLDSVMTFHWTNNFAVENFEYTAEKIEEIKQSIFVKFVDDYFDKLVQAGVLEIVQPTEVQEAEGGYDDVTKVGYGCWSSRSLFSKKTHCANYTYKVKEWFDGMTDKDLTHKLNITSTITEEVQVNEMVPFYYSSTFIK